MRRPHHTAASLSPEDNGAKLDSLLDGDWSPVPLSTMPSIHFSEYSHPTNGDWSNGVSNVGDSCNPLTPQEMVQNRLSCPRVRDAGGGDAASVNNGGIHTMPPTDSFTPTERGPAFSVTRLSGRRSTRSRMRAPRVIQPEVPLQSQIVKEPPSTRVKNGLEESGPVSRLLFSPVLEKERNVKAPSSEQPTEEDMRESWESHSFPVSDLSQHQEPSSLSSIAGKNSNSGNDVNKHLPFVVHRRSGRGSLPRRSARRSATTLFSAVEPLEMSDKTNCVSLPPLVETSPSKTLKASECFTATKGAEAQAILPSETDSDLQFSVSLLGKASRDHSTAISPFDLCWVQRAESMDTATAETGKSQFNGSLFSFATSNVLGEGSRLNSETMGGDGTEKRECGPLHTVSTSDNDTRTELPKNSDSFEQLSQLVKRTSDPEVLHLIREHFLRNNSDPQRHAFVVLCDKLAKEMEENPGEKNARRAAVMDGDEEEDDKRMSSIEDFDCHDTEDDEFDDDNIKESVYPKKDPHRNYTFANPSVQGKSTSVFSSGMLYKILRENGEFFFFNDTLHYVMVVRVQCRLWGDETIDEKVVQTQMGNGETELTLAIPPEATCFLMKTVRDLPRVWAKGVAPPKDFVAPSVKRNMHDVDMGINNVRSKLGQWSRAGDQKSLLKCCLHNGLRFTDLEFRPSANSLCRPDADTATFSFLTWRRPVDYLMLTEVSQARLFRRNISSHLVRQGSLGDHTVIGGIAAVAMFPFHVRWMFRHPVSSAIGKREREVGAYRVTLCMGGWWTTLLLDDYFPASLKAPLFARCAVDPRRLWVSFLEKAYAKALGSYAALCAADALEVLTDFTGFPCRNLDVLWSEAANDPEAAKALYKYIHSCARRQFLIMVYTPSPLKPSSAPLMDNLICPSTRFVGSGEGVSFFLPGHVYFITETLYYEDLDLRLVRLKNPWTWSAAGRTRRPFGWKRSKWFEQPENSTTMGASSVIFQSKGEDGRGGGDGNALKQKELGTMWLEWSEAFRSFEGGGVCYTLWNWKEYRIRGRFCQCIPTVVLEVRVEQKAECILTISQESRLRRLGSARKFRYDAMLLFVSRHMAASNMEFLACTSAGDIESPSEGFTYTAARDVSVRCIFEPEHSPYYVIPRVYHFSDWEEIPFVLSLLCDTVIGGDDAQVHFRHLDPSCRVFQDMSSFTVDAELCRPVTATYQCRTPAGVSAYEGQCIRQQTWRSMRQMHLDDG
ncbi:calpain-like cysteine peptidase, putative [Trypanosoma cruzi]|uniref:Calpain-like cysteine peptidase, putative n=1 Tax=Trypanosoma cruzi (strain CL Brener) TaxID=353153 RepID=Q4D608_TRYCC|nr:calpain-like cysteine peptidase, putative [Trypanosoma cruzi]EAN87964.1 calpain-like cysteine peptidase, putative [Trypanosoma cruzi]|eukprot:XP_809815.1 calpain-like cysteine peptidase [Trypanosoma cruzi strain CL Brener]